MSNGTIVLSSGGQDSTTCLYWTKRQVEKGFLPGPIRTVAFDYGQKHKVELLCAEQISVNGPAISHTVIPVEGLKVLGGAALTDDSIEVQAVADEFSGNAHAIAHGLPSTFVPGRNMMFLTLAAAFGAKYGAYDLVTGVCEADAAGYPDCREEFILSAQRSLSLALDDSVQIHAPLLELDKAGTWALADELGVLPIIVDETHTCYNGNHTIKHPWGYGCGSCPACTERGRGYDKYLAKVVFGR